MFSHLISQNRKKKKKNMRKGSNFNKEKFQEKKIRPSGGRKKTKTFEKLIKTHVLYR
jgi:ABC-type sulfate transport system substrate-binding protein